ncbi:MAG TPA: hypothetical protein VGU01_00505 [Sphingomicrobium sp.]|nr:hypothetical protein [Sphingomicrobium sp.]
MLSHSLLLSAAIGLTPIVPDAAQVFAPGVISAGASDAALTLSPDGTEAFFERGNGQSYAIMQSRLTKSGWSQPKVAPFSGTWVDLESAMSADGSYLVFSSNRPAKIGDKPIDGFFYGKLQVAKGGALWRVNRTDTGWSKPFRLPSTINISNSIYEPSIAGNGDIYFQSADEDGKAFHLYFVRAFGDQYTKAELIDLNGPAGSSDMDPAIARDGSYLVFSSNRDSTGDHHLYIAFKTSTGWSAPKLLGPDVNISSVGDPRLDEKNHRLYFSTRKLAPPSGDTQADLDDAAHWNNGLSNIWFVHFDVDNWRI